MKDQLFRCFEEIHSFSYNFDLPCLNKCNGNCESGALLLLPYENEYLSMKVKTEGLIFPNVAIGDFWCGFIGEDEPHCTALGKDGATCNLFPWMPVDCLTYPVFPIFNGGGNANPAPSLYLYLSHFCLLHKDITYVYITFAKKVWNMLLPYIPMEWMKFYNGNILPFFLQYDVLKI